MNIHRFFFGEKYTQIFRFIYIYIYTHTHIYVVCDETRKKSLSFYENLFTTLLEKLKVPI